MYDVTYHKKYKKYIISKMGMGIFIIITPHFLEVHVILGVSLV